MLMRLTWMVTGTCLALGFAACLGACDDGAGGETETATLAMGTELPPPASTFDKGSFLTSPVEGDTIGPCSSTRWIGRAPAGKQCPDPQTGGFSLEVKYETSNPVAVPGAVGAYCLYTWTEASVPTAAKIMYGLPAIDATGAMGWLDPDCHVVAPLAGCDPPVPSSPATSIANYMGQRRVDHFFAQSEPMPIVPIRTDSGAGEVYVAMVDTAVNLDGAMGPGTGTSHHGRVLGGIVRTLTCRSASNCAAVISNHLALDVVSPGVQDKVCGGNFGYQSVLAEAIDGAVDGFQTFKAKQFKPQKARLVINLSVGWDPRYSCDDSMGGVCQLTEGARLVRAALRRAACAGALIIAAAGNKSSGPDQGTGFMLPAAWMSEPALTSEMCAKGQYDIDFDPEDPTNFELWGGVSSPGWQHPPLVWAVGGVDARDEALQNGRDGARPIFAAPSFEGLFMDRVTRKVAIALPPDKTDPEDSTETETTADPTDPTDPTDADSSDSKAEDVVEDPSDPAEEKAGAALVSWTNAQTKAKRPSPALTGTSVGAAVISAIAADVWHWRPNLTTGDVMWLVYRESEPLAVSADACFGGECEIARASMCRAVGAACGPYGCGLSKCIQRTAYDGVTMTWDASEVANVGTFTSGLYTFTPPLTACVSASISMCGVDYDFYGPSCSVPDPCPEETEPNGVVAPWVDPQPGWTPCGACALLLDTTNSDVLLSIDARFGGSVVNGRLVTTDDLGGTDTYHFASSIGTLNPGDALTVRVDGLDASILRTAAVVFDEVSSGTTYTDAVPISAVNP